MHRIAVLTSGGDAPGMNAAIRAVTRQAISRGVEVMGVRCGYAGLIAGDMVYLTARKVGGIIEQGGTILESRRCDQFTVPEGRAQAIQSLAQNHIDGLIVIGGNGSQAGALSLFREGVRVNGVASTIDNDLAGTDITIGVDSALNVVLEAIDRLRTTASSHHRLFIIETMGRDCGYLALAAGIAGGAEVIVTPEVDLPPHAVIEEIKHVHRRGKHHAIVVVAEGAKNNARTLYDALRNHPHELFEPRLTILGHVQRGARPSAHDRLLATRLGAHAVELLIDGDAGQLIGLRNGAIQSMPLSEIVGVPKPLPAELIVLARIMCE